MPCIAFCQVSTPSEGKSLNTLEMIDKMKQAALSGAKLAVFGERALNTGFFKGDCDCCSAIQHCSDLWLC